MSAEHEQPMEILVIEDDPGVAALLRRALSFEGYRVRLAESGTQALDALRLGFPDLIVLDLMLPGVDGIEVARRVRASEARSGQVPVPILMLTARDTVADRVRGLDAGGDDYLVKPFALDELLARIRALKRRSVVVEEVHRDRPIEYETVTMHLPARVARRGERDLNLTQREFDLLAFFLQHPNIVLTRAQIMDRVWGPDFPGDSNVLEVFIGNLRKELEAEGEPRLIQTVRGIGYVLRAAPAK